MSKTTGRILRNADLRHQSQMAGPQLEVLEKELYRLLTPESFKPLKESRGIPGKKLRSRLLNLPVIRAVVIGLVYRRIAGLRELLRILSEEGLLWIEPMQVSVEALSKRLRTLPVQLFVEIFEQVMFKLKTEEKVKVIPEKWQGISEKFTGIWIADGSTWEELFKRLKTRRECNTVLGGKTWYRYLTNVLDPEELSAQQVCELYRNRWQIEQAFLLTKRLLGLAYLWGGDSNGIQIQI